MKLTKTETVQLKKAFLVLAAALVSIIALLYGVNPAWFAGTFLGADDLGVNVAHILRAVMCLYLALGVFWLVSAFNDRLRDPAILTVLVFAGGLFIGRMLSFATDGQPAPLLIVYAGLELLVVPVAAWLYTRPK